MDKFRNICDDCYPIIQEQRGYILVGGVWMSKYVHKKNAAQQMRAADVLPCGHTQDHESMLLETGEFVCDQCGAIHR